MSLNIDYNTPTVLNVLIERIQNLKKSGKFEDAIRAAETAVESARRLIEDRPCLLYTSPSPRDED